MKRIIVIFIIAVCLLFSTWGISCLAQEPVNYGKIWNSWSDYMRSIYIMGFKDGLQGQIYDSFITRLMIEEKDVFDKYLKDSEVVKIEEARNKTSWDFIMFDGEVIKNVMTDLYKDPANAYIYIDDMAGLAYWKLKGENISSFLQEARKKPYQIKN
ncbi:hypothetical protein ES702_07104 [subsurface metagenome]